MYYLKIILLSIYSYNNYSYSYRAHFIGNWFLYYGITNLGKINLPKKREILPRLREPPNRINLLKYLSIICLGLMLITANIDYSIFKIDPLLLWPIFAAFFIGVTFNLWCI